MPLPSFPISGDAMASFNASNSPLRSLKPSRVAAVEREPDSVPAIRPISRILPATPARSSRILFSLISFLRVRSATRSSSRATLRLSGSPWLLAFSKRSLEYSRTFCAIDFDFRTRSSSKRIPTSNQTSTNQRRKSGSAEYTCHVGRRGKKEGTSSARSLSLASSTTSCSEADRAPRPRISHAVIARSSSRRALSSEETALTESRSRHRFTKKKPGAKRAKKKRSKA